MKLRLCSDLSSAGWLLLLNCTSENAVFFCSKNTPSKDQFAWVNTHDNTRQNWCICTHTHDSIQLAECNLDSNLKLKTPTSTDSPKKWWKRRSCWCGDVCPLWSFNCCCGGHGKSLTCGGVKVTKSLKSSAGQLPVLVLVNTPAPFS